MKDLLDLCIPRTSSSWPMLEKKIRGGKLREKNVIRRILLVLHFIGKYVLVHAISESTMRPMALQHDNLRFWTYVSLFERKQKFVGMDQSTTTVLRSFWGEIHALLTYLMGWNICGPNAGHDSWCYNDYKKKKKGDLLRLFLGLIH